eukprot:TRINITY_DN439_c1_g1_i2.p1 TRINITY_DN439_c1_g1~~TRINITY_DN439_c1_g1_i2.p1  ORF type:complete len:585 (+),score=179.51 TRINITY_DN439_c1_g1_i2:251-2005(+)
MMIGTTSIQLNDAKGKCWQSKGSHFQMDIAHSATNEEGNWGYRFVVRPVYHSGPSVEKIRRKSLASLVSMGCAMEKAQSSSEGWTGVAGQIAAFIGRTVQGKELAKAIYQSNFMQLTTADFVQYPLLQDVRPQFLRFLAAYVVAWSTIQIQHLPMFDVETLGVQGRLANKLVHLREFLLAQQKKGVLERVKNAMATGSKSTFGGGFHGIPELTLTRISKDTSVFEQASSQINGIDASRLRGTDRAWKVVFSGEGAQDAGGPYRDSITQLCQEFVSPELGLMIPCKNAELASQGIGKGNNRDKFIPNPSATSPSQLGHFEFMGKVIGVAIRTESPISLNLPGFVWKPLVGQALGSKDLAEVDEFTWQALEQLRDLARGSTGNVVTNDNFSDVIEEVFVTQLSDGSEVELVPDGRNVAVTFDNCLEYTKLVEKARLAECDEQVRAIGRGIASIVPSTVLQLMTWRELEVVVCGSPHIDVDQLRRNTKYKDFVETDKTIQFFWQVLEEFSDDERSLFLRFVYGRDRLPGRDDDRLKVCRQPGSDGLPRAATCFFQLFLRDYESPESLKKELLIAITNCIAIDTDYEV